MSQLKIVTASAGSGKTYRLASELEDAVADNSARPDAIVATTFTRKAAAELSERARARLLEVGRTADAHRLLAARIGTVNSVCGRLVTEHAFELGLSPQVTILDEHQAAAVFRRTLSSVLTPEDTAKLGALNVRIEELDWQEAVQRVVAAARANGLGPKDFPACAQRSVESLLAFFATPDKHGAPLTEALRQACRHYVEFVGTLPNGAVGSRETAKRCKEVLTDLERGQLPPWHQWAWLVTRDPPRDSKSQFATVRIAAEAHDRHPDLQADLTDAIHRVYDVAARGLTAYQEQKRARGAIDFIDQEALALELLQRDDVRDQLREEIDLLLVDEFQDTSPIQLAIFLALARCAKRTVWVGDQKQAIFGFRGTDPALMDDTLSDLSDRDDPELIGKAINYLIEVEEPETLGTSYRSRPELVRLTSDVFAPAFEAHAIPEERTRLAPHLTDADEPSGLGSIIEHWPLVDAKNKRKRAEALAAGLRTYLASEAGTVRDVITGEARTARASDIAVLCRTNEQCALVADALEALDIRAIVPRVGLMNTAEARTALCGLKLWIDPRAAQPAAELVRIFDYPDDADGWLHQTLGAPGFEAFASAPAIQAIAEARKASPAAGVLAAIDAVIATLELRTRCREWGDEPTRIANLDALRAHAVAYVDACATDHTPSTVPGLLAYFDALTEEVSFPRKPREDHQAVRAGDNAVVVSTWHAAKGLEWPITVLFGLEKRYSRDALGVRVVSDNATFKIDDPLAGRWVRFWPTPYSGLQKGTPFKDRMEQSPEHQAAVEKGDREALRLLYVGWTRARDRLVFAAQEKGLLTGILGQLADINPSLMSMPVAGHVTWAGRTVPIAVRPTTPSASVPRSITPGAAYPQAPAVQYPPKSLSPSTLATAGRAGTPVPLGPAMTLSGDAESRALGDAVHTYLGADRADLDHAGCVSLAKDVLERWGVAECVAPDDLVAAGDRLDAWLKATFPGGRIMTEWPVQQMQPSGTVVRGVADLLVIHDGAVHIIDHKCLGGDLERVLSTAAGYAGQAHAYAQAFAAAEDAAVGELFIHLPLSGLIVPVAL